MQVKEARFGASGVTGSPTYFFFLLHIFLSPPFYNIQSFPPPLFIYFILSFFPPPHILFPHL